MRFAIPTMLLAASLPALSRPAQAQTPAQTPAKPAKAGAPGQGPAAVQGPGAVQGPVSTPVVGCPSLANYRLLRREAPDETAVTARLSDAKADHLGCTAFPRDRVAGLADHVALGGARYDCLALQGTAVCQWTAAGTVDLPAATKPKPKPSSPDKARR